MSDMVYAPLFADLDSEREVVLEEIAMYEDTPQELVHDLMREAVFGDHPLGRPVIGTAEVISSSAGARCDATTDDVPGRQRRRRRGGNLEHDDLVARLAAGERSRRRRRQGPARPQPARAAAAPERPLPAQAHRAVPRLPRRARDRALRSAPLRRVAARRDARRLGLVAALPGDPREARHGLLRLHVRVAVHGQRADRLLRRDAPENLGDCLEIANEQIAEVAEGRLREGELERAKENLKGGSCSRWSRPRTG
jgi:hypothetical protein